MIEAQAGATFMAILETGGVTGLVGTLQVKIETPEAVVIFGPTTAGIVEVEAGIYAKADLVAPGTPGDYLVIWVPGAPHSAASEALKVTSAPVATAPMPELAWLRRLLEDVPHTEIETAMADGTETEFLVSNSPITTGSAVIKVNGTVVNAPADYSVGALNDRIVFVSPPPEDARIDIMYQRNTWPDDELETYLTAAGNDWDANTVEKVTQAAVYGVDSVMIGAATALNFGAGEETYDMVSVWERLQRMREMWDAWLTTRMDKPYLSIIDIEFDVDDPEFPGDWANYGSYYYGTG